MRAGLSALRDAEVRAIAFAAFDIVVQEPEVAEDLVEQAYENLVAAVPELKPVIDLVVFPRKRS